MYSKVVLNAFNNPKNTGRISKPDGIADNYNFDSTAHVEFSLRIESGVITNCQFRAQANPYIIAICSTITQMVKGKMVSMVFLDPYSIKTELGDESDYDILFCIDCLKMAIDDYKEKLVKENKQGKKQEKVEVQEEPIVTEEVEEIEQEKVEQTATNSTEEDPDDDFDFSDFFDDIDV